MRAPCRGHQAVVPGPVACAGRERRPSLSRSSRTGGPPLAPASELGGAGAGPRCLHPPVPSSRSSGGTEQRGPNGQERGEARRGEARRRQWERHRRGPRSSGPGWDRRPRHEPRSRTPRCAARGPRRAASASPGPRPGAGDELPRLRMMVDCQVSRCGAL